MQIECPLCHGRDFERDEVGYDVCPQCGGAKTLEVCDVCKLDMDECKCEGDGK